MLKWIMIITLCLLPIYVPIDFHWAKIATMALIHETKGSGWGMVTKWEYLRSSNPGDDDKTQKQMTRSKEFKFAHTLFQQWKKLEF
jgi:hypothetical protein